MLPNREGRFKASIGEHGVAETGPNNLATFACTFHLTQELVSGEWVPAEDDLAITGYFYLEKRDGSLNTVTIDNLKEAFGWDGRDPFWLQDTDFTDHVVQVKLVFEEYGGKTRIKVQYVNSESWSGGVPMADDTVRRSIAGRLGAKFRANAGGTSLPTARTSLQRRQEKITPAENRQDPAAAPPATKPDSPDAHGSRNTDKGDAAATMQQAWEAFAEACPDAWSRQDIEDAWFRVLGEMFLGKQPEQLTPADWARVLNDAPSELIPI